MGILYVFLGLLVITFIGALIISRSSRKRELEREQAALAAVKRTAEEDVTEFGEEVAYLDTITAGVELDEGGRQDYQRALNAYDTAKETLDAAKTPDAIKHVTEALEDGRYAASCVRARVDGKPLPTRTPPCFFNPQHGPSVENVDWAPPGGQPRPVPVCAADAERVAVGAEPAIRKVTMADGYSRRNYWEAGPAYAPYNRGYFDTYAGSGLLPGMLMGAMMFGGFGHGFDGSYADGYQDGLDAGGGDAGDGDFGGGDFGGGDFGGGDFGGDFGGFGF